MHAQAFSNPSSHCRAGRATQAFIPARSKPRQPEVSAKAASTANDVRVTIMRDGTITYHFFETAKEVLVAEEPAEATLLERKLRADQTAQATTSTSMVSFETSPAIAAYLADRLRSRPQARPESPSAWSRQLALLQRGNKNAKYAAAPEVRPRPTRKAAQYASAAVQYQHLNGNGSSALQQAGLDDSLDFEESGTELLLRAYSSRAAAGRLDAALQVLQGVIKAGRVDVLSRVKHKVFLRAAAEQRAVSHAMRFVQLLPDRLTDARTYNMLVSVCVAAKDLKGALRAGQMLKQTGRKIDTFLYTSLITACAIDGDTNTGFQLYEEMRNARVPTDPRVYTALISTCSRKIAKSDSAEGRRDQLVLLERAFGIFHDMQEARVRADAAVWNALIGTAGRAGQLHRAFQALEDMQDNFQRPDEHTFVSLIHACRKADEHVLALKVYQNALDCGLTQCVMLYDAAVAACQSTSHIDLDTALEIYSEMQRHGVLPDAQLYSSLICIAGRAHQVDLAFQLQTDMVAHGQHPSEATYSALILACLENKQLERADELYQLTIEAGLQPDVHAYNALINAHGRASEFGQAVRLVGNMVKGDSAMDAFTFTAILNACQRANEAQVALEVFRHMRQRGLKMDDTLCFIMLRLCYNRLRDEWYPGGYPPTPDKHPSHTSGEISPAGRHLIKVLVGDTAVLERQGDVNWVSAAMAAYRQALNDGLRPSLKVLDRMLACLRLPYIAPIAEPAPSLQPAPFKGSYIVAEAAPMMSVAQRQGAANDTAYDVSAVPILEEAIALGVVPAFRLDVPCTVDARHLPPSVAEVYVLAMTSALRRANDTMSLPTAVQPITFLVPTYDPAQLFFPSYALDEFSPQQRGPGQQSVASLDDEEEAWLQQPLSAVPLPMPVASTSRTHEVEESHVASDRTALGVIGMLRRLALWTEEDAWNGKLTILPKNTMAWLHNIHRASAKSQSQRPLQHPQSIGKSIASQQRQLRSASSRFQLNNGYSNGSGNAASWNGNGSSNGQRQSRRRSNQGYRAQPQPEPIEWDVVQTATRQYEALRFDE